MKGKWKLFVCIALVACVIFSASNNVFAAINPNYGSGGEVRDENIDDKVNSNRIWKALGALIYGLGSLIELLTSKVFKLVTGSATFPWADAILFNAVPFLDVNIFTADTGSLIGKVYTFLTGTYYSLLTLASTFFGIAVMFSAVKLVITAIAEDKAKYKKAIADWLLGLVMLWGMHFFMSFVLYLNEELVATASSLATSSLGNSENNSTELSKVNSTKESEEYIKKFIDLMTDNGWNYGADTFNKDWGLQNQQGSYVSATEELKSDVRTILQYSALAMRLLENKDISSYLNFNASWNSDTETVVNESLRTSLVRSLSEHITELTESQSERTGYEESLENSENYKESFPKYTSFLNAYVPIYNEYKPKAGTPQLKLKGDTFVYSIAKFFKDSAWKKGAKSWKSTKVSVTSAVIYVILVCYSIVFFISYTKRLFYVIILIMMAPIVVVFNFFVNFGK